MTCCQGDRTERRHCSVVGYPCCSLVVSYVQGSARTQEGATPAATKRAPAGEGGKGEGQGEKGEGDADAEEAAALLHHFANGRL